MKISKSAIHFIIGLECIVLLFVVVLSVFFSIEQKSNYKEEDYYVESENTELETTENNEEKPEEEKDSKTESDADTVFSKDILKKVDNMKIEEKVAQVFLTTPEELTGIDQVTVTGETSKNALKEYPVGGIVYSEKNFLDKEQTSKMMKEIQSYSKEELKNPLFLALKEQGGESGSPLATKNDYSVGLSASELGVREDEEVAKKQAKEIGSYLKEEGLNLNLGINGDLKGGIDATYDATTFSDNKEVCSKFLVSTIEGYQEANILTAMGMFPSKSKGLELNQEMKNWEENQKVVYQAGIDANVMSIIVGNGIANTMTKEEKLPCCFSPKVVEYLRVNMRYKNIIISDNLSENHITETYNSKESAVAAMNAGMDMLYYTSDFKDAYQGLLEAVKSGQVSEERIDEAVARILTCKMALES